MTWELDAKQEFDEMSNRAAELRLFLEKETISGEYYYVCKDCKKLFGRVRNEYSTHDMCSDCWDKRELEAKAKEMDHLLGCKIAEVRVVKGFVDEKPIISELIVEKDGKKIKLELHHEPAVIL